MKHAIPIAALFALLTATAYTASATAKDFISDDELFAIELKKNEALVLIRIEDNKGKPIEGAVISVRKGKFGKAFSKASDKIGRIELLLPVNNSYDITFLSLDTSATPHVERFEFNGTPEQRQTLVMTYKEPTTKTFVLEGVEFETGKVTLTKSSFAKLEPLLEYLKMKPDISIELSGHTDNVGEGEANLQLSDGRARAVKEYLIANGIDADRINAVGYGDTRPLATNDSAAGRKKNRRTEVRILD